VRATLRCSPEPNERQKEEFLRGYLDAARPADALPWLYEAWDRHEDGRLRGATASAAAHRPSVTWRRTVAGRMTSPEIG
jgi:hypothetical protein